MKDGKITEISDIRDESNKEGIRLVIELKKDSDPNVVLNKLHKFSNLSTSFSSRLLSIVEGIPRTLNLQEYLNYFLSFRKKILVNKFKFELKQFQDRLHILEGLVIALKNIDEIVKKIKNSKDGKEAKQMLIKDYKLTEIQAQSILDMKLQKLTGLEMDKIKQEYENTKIEIKKIEEILASDKKQYKLIRKDFEKMKEEFGEERKTKIIKSDLDVNIEDLIKDENFIVILTQNEYVKKVSIDDYRLQKRGGKGTSTNIKSEDIIKNLFLANSKDNLLIFTNNGNLNWLKIFSIPTTSSKNRGRPLVNYIDLKGKKVTNVINVSNLNEGYLIFLTKKGIIKKTEMKNFSKPRHGGIKAINLEEGDTVLSVLYVKDESQDIICQSNKGLAIRFSQKDLNILGRAAKGVKAMKLKENEEVVGMELAKPETSLLSICEKGFGKRTLLSEYPTIHRGGRGVIDIKTDDRNGDVVGMKAVRNEDEVLIVSKNGKVVRTNIRDVRIIGRNTKGVRIVNLEEGDSIEKFEIIESEEKEN